MKKIERSYLTTHYSTIKGLPDIRYVKVKETDLDELEQQRDELIKRIEKLNDINLRKADDIFEWWRSMFCYLEEIKAGKDE